MRIFLMTTLTAACALAVPGMASAGHLEQDAKDPRAQRIEALKTGIDILDTEAAKAKNAFYGTESLRQKQGRLLMDLRRTQETREAAPAKAE